MGTTPHLRRRTVLKTAAATSALLAAPGAADIAQASGGRDRARAGIPEIIELPVGLRPEGITSGPRTTYYVGSLADGRIVTGDLLDGTGDLLLPGEEGRSIRGLHFDHRTGLVWAVGGLGTANAVAHVWAVNSRNGDIVSDTVVPAGVFFNDLVVTRRSVWVTDSKVNRLTRIELGRGGQPTMAAASFVDLTGDFPALDVNANNANGIRALPDGNLVMNNTRAGGLWQVDVSSGNVTEIVLEGTPAVTGGDGLEIWGDLLFVVRGSGPNEVTVVRLKSSGKGSDGQRVWTGKVLGILTDETLDIPSTATVAAGALWAVNARFGVSPPATASARYWITQLPIRRVR
ncbi:MAG TPA: hypothetical protein VFP89_05390 [Propionibacteriaceae bacterium]|nr:hypothetical protein [Propionibacteriaceae bacterium]